MRISGKNLSFCISHTTSLFLFQIFIFFHSSAFIPIHSIIFPHHLDSTHHIARTILPSLRGVPPKTGRILEKRGRFSEISRRFFLKPRTFLKKPRRISLSTKEDAA